MSQSTSVRALAASGARSSLVAAFLILVVWALGSVAAKANDGFLVASLLVLILISFVHRRAVRLTQRRLEDAIPVSMAEIQADKDSLRAEFAMSARRLELSVEQLNAKATMQLHEIARKTGAINRLKAELAEKTAVTDALDAEAKSLSSKIREAEREYEVKTAAFEANERALAIKEAELAKAASDINEQRLATGTQRVEIAVLKIQVAQFKARIDDLQQEAQDAARLLSEERVAVGTITKELEEKRQAVDTLRPQVARLEGEITAHTHELENRARRIDDLESRNGDQARILAEREAAYNELRQQRDAEVSALRQQHESEVAALRQQHDAGVAALHQQRESEVAALRQERESEVAALRQERDTEVAALRQEIAADRAEHSSRIGRLQEDNSALESLLADANDRLASHPVRIDDLEKQLAERDRMMIIQRDSEAKPLHNEIAAAKRESDAGIERLQADEHFLERLLQMEVR
jgi:chromosome segregation ATPase